jgi:hypothetical protein
MLMFLSILECRETHTEVAQSSEVCDELGTCLSMNQVLRSVVMNLISEKRGISVVVLV